MLSGPGGRREGSSSSSGPPSSALETMGLSDVLLDGAARPLRTLTQEIEARLGRVADAGDLLVMLASVPGGVASHALVSLGVDAEQLTQAAEKARRAEARSHLLPSHTLTEAERLCAEKDAIGARALAEAEQPQDDLLDELRRRLGLTGK